MEFYIVDAANKNIRYRVLYEDVILCQSHKTGCVVVFTNRPNLLIKNTIDTVYDFYFQKNPSFIRSNANYIVNTRHIITAEEKIYNTEILLTLTNNNTASLRRSHDYAYFILNNRHRQKNTPLNSDEKDAIILSEIRNVKDVVAEIKRVTGEDVTSRYVVKRYKQLKFYV